jgi:hypothetical protein
MAEDQKNNQASPTRPAPALSERLQKCVAEIEALVLQGVEHPQYEFKRSASIAKGDLDDRLDFTKLLQGVANSEVSAERYIVIGADPKDKQFYPVSNASTFDPATVNSVVGKYLDPLPQYEVFNNLETKDKKPIVVFILNPVQPRPILVKTEGQKVGGKVRLQIGEIWIKKGTSLQAATRADIDAMYRQRMEEEAEDRARKRFKHFTELSGAPPSIVYAQPRMPVRELLVGPAADFRRFAEELMAANDQARFLMLMELIRESLTEGWDKHEVRQSMQPSEYEGYAARINDFFRDEFLPALQSAVSMALLIIRYDFQTEWFQAVVDVLLKAFDEAHGLQRLKFGYFSQLQDALRYWRPGFEVFMAIRCIAVYAVMRDRPKFYRFLLQPLVIPVDIDEPSRPKTPILFRPLPADTFGDKAFEDGRATFYWKERISGFWGSYFVTFEKFLAASYQLEFLLEFNSHLAMNSVKDHELGEWMKSNYWHVWVSYSPDIFNRTLELAVPMAERLYDVVMSQEASVSAYEILPKLFAAAFKTKPQQQRLLMYGGFIDNLRTWQAQARMQQFHRFPFMFSWHGRLEEAVKKYREQAKFAPP